MSDEFQQRQNERRKGKSDYRDLKKHYVRVNGWLPVFRSRADERDGKVRYLTLCAKEAIDVRYFASKGLLLRNGTRNDYPLLAFVEADAEDYAAIAETLGRFRLGIHARLEDVLLNPEHEQYEVFRASFPYDVINLDFCGEIMPKKDVPYSETIRCIEEIVSLQASSDATLCWHMFLTFRTHRIQHNEEANDQLRDILDGNLKTGVFRSSYGARPDPSGLLNANYPEFLRLGIAKYLASAAERQGYAMKLVSSWVYGRNNAAYHMVKLVAEMTPLNAPGALRNRHRGHQAYEAAVLGIFGSAATDVEGALGDASVAAALQAELDAVLRDIDDLKIVLA